MTNERDKADALRFIPIDVSFLEAPLRVCAVLPSTEASLFLLSSGPGFRASLGALVDVSGRVVEWLELGVQTVSGLSASPAAVQERLTNAQLDGLWLAAGGSAAGPDLWTLGWENAAARPCWLDLEVRRPWHPRDEATGRDWRLCTDDSALRAAGLPPYSGSLHRYWSLTGVNGTGVFVAATADAPTSAATRPLSGLLPGGRTLLPFNPEGGRLYVRRLAPLSFTDYVDLLGGRAWRGFTHDQGWCKLPGTYGALADWDRLMHEREHLFLGGRGRMGILAETFHLRLVLILQMMQAVAEVTRRTQLPFLNLNTEAFRLSLAPTGPAGAVLWGARPGLGVDPASVALPVKDSRTRFFLPLGVPATTVFRPEGLGVTTRGRGEVRLRRVTTDTQGLTAVEGTLVTAERLQLSEYDLVRLQLPLQGPGQTEIYARLDPAEGLAVGESRFRTEPQGFAPAVQRALRAAEGNTLPGTPFESIPLLGPPCDLYALGVLAVRTLLVNPQNSLAVALDEVLSFARQLGAATSGDERGQRALELVAEDSRWISSLGPHRLTHEPMTPELALTAVPETLWWRAVATVAAFFPGQGPSSYCRDFGDFSPYAIEQVYTRPLSDLALLAQYSRGVLFSDYAANREVATVLRRLGGEDGRRSS